MNTKPFLIFITLFWNQLFSQNELKYIIALNGTECACLENGQKINKLLKNFEDLNFNIYVSASNNSEAEMILKKTFRFDLDAYKNYKIIGDRKLYNKYSNKIDSYVTVLYKNKILYQNFLSLTTKDSLNSISRPYNLEKKENRILNTMVDKDVFKGGNYLFNINDSMYLIRNFMYNTYTLLNTNNNFSQEYFNKQTQKMLIDNFWSNESDIDLIRDSVIQVFEKEKLFFFKISNSKVYNNNLFTIGRFNFFQTKEDLKNSNLDISFLKILKDNLKDSIILIEIESPVSFKMRPIILNTSLNDVPFSIDKLGYFYFLVFMPADSFEIDENSSDNLKFPFLVKYKLNNNQLDFVEYLPLQLPKYYVESKLYYYNNYFSFLEDKNGNSFGYFKNLNQFYSFEKKESINLENLNTKGLNLIDGKQNKPFEILTASFTSKNDLSLILFKKKEYYFQIYCPKTGKLKYSKQIKKLINPAFNIANDKLHILETPLQNESSISIFNF
jgi:hypothetical protein